MYNHFMNTDLLHQIIQDNCGLNHDQIVLVGVSGGPDSICLLNILVGLGYKVVVAHFNHKLRDQAPQDALFVETEANRMGLRFILGELDVADYAQKYKLSIEEAARQARYHFLFEQASHLDAQAVAVAHTANDQVETVLMHLLRGSGLAGLRGMSYRSFLEEWSLSIPLVRPLLDVWRDDILEYCESQGLNPVTDSTNFNTNYYRNRLRHELIPFLEAYNPQIKDVIWRMANTLAGDQEIIGQIVQENWERCWLKRGDGFVVLDLGALKQISKALQRQVIRRAIGTLRPILRDVDYKAVERAIIFINNPGRSGQIDLISGLRLFIELDRLYLAEKDIKILDKDWPQMAIGSAFSLTCPGELQIGADWLLTCDNPTDRQVEEINLICDDPMQAWLDAQTLEFPLIVRTRQPGDRFQPLGLDGHSLKLSDFWINQKLSARARPGWPLLCNADQIVWLPGFRPSHSFRVRQDTRQMVHLRVSKSH
ncbi:MAG: tRNA lysidine(34) synthetase TilS [Anaerolineaceae bacterium]|nr:tRNA lysidine(34) synthetase TilS [Anaerolineaceae bacterium]